MRTKRAPRCPDAGDGRKLALRTLIAGAGTRGGGEGADRTLLARLLDSIDVWWLVGQIEELQQCWLAQSSGRASSDNDTYSQGGEAQWSAEEIGVSKASFILIK